MVSAPLLSPSPIPQRAPLSFFLLNIRGHLLSPRTHPPIAASLYFPLFPASASPSASLSLPPPCFPPSQNLSSHCHQLPSGSDKAPVQNTQCKTSVEEKYNKTRHYMTTNKRIMAPRKTRVELLVCPCAVCTCEPSSRTLAKSPQSTCKGSLEQCNWNLLEWLLLMKQPLQCMQACVFVCMSAYSSANRIGPGKAPAPVPKRRRRRGPGLTPRSG